MATAEQVNSMIVGDIVSWTTYGRITAITPDEKRKKKYCTVESVQGGDLDPIVTTDAVNLFPAWTTDAPRRPISVPELELLLSVISGKPMKTVFIKSDGSQREAQGVVLGFQPEKGLCTFLEFTEADTTRIRAFHSTKTLTLWVADQCFQVYHTPGTQEEESE